MKCPFCGFLEDKVVDSRESREGEAIRRRRECLKCERRFTSYERIDEIPYMVVKKDGRREAFDRNLDEINQVVFEYDKILQENPQDELTGEMLDSALNEKVELLREFSEL